jgi:hypothetical protein
MCLPCWEDRYPGREPHVVLDSPTVMCCYCGNFAENGIYLRQDPAEVRCRGKGGIHVGDA